MNVSKIYPISKINYPNEKSINIYLFLADYVRFTEIVEKKLQIEPQPLEIRVNLKFEDDPSKDTPIQVDRNDQIKQVLIELGFVRKDQAFQLRVSNGAMILPTRSFAFLKENETISIKMIEK